MARSRGPSAVAQVRTTTSEGRDKSSRPGARRDSTRSEERQNRSCGRTDSDRPRYQSRTSPLYQATPTDQRGDPTGRSHTVTAPSPDSRKRRRSRKATARPTTRTASRTKTSVVIVPEESWRLAGHDAGGELRPGWIDASGVLAGGPEAGLGAPGGVQGLRLLTGLLGAAECLAGALDVDLGRDLG